MKSLLLACCLIIALDSGWTVPFSSLTKLKFQYFTYPDQYIGAVLSSSLIVDVPSCLNISDPAKNNLSLVVSKIDPSGLIDTSEIKYLNTDSTAQTYYAARIPIPQCRVKRELQSMSEFNVLSYKVGTDDCKNTKDTFCNQILQPGSDYWLTFLVLNADGAPVSYTEWSAARTTRNVTKYENMDTGLTGRSGGMVTITVLLSVAMFILVIGLITVPIVSRGKYLLPSESQDALDVKTNKHH